MFVQILSTPKGFFFPLYTLSYFVQIDVHTVSNFNELSKNFHSKPASKFDTSIYIVYTYRMTTTIQKWGNSLAVRLSKHVAESVDFEEGNLVEVTVENNEVVIRAVPKTEYSLKTLLKGVTLRNKHSAIDWGSPRGKEIW